MTQEEKINAAVEKAVAEAMEKARVQAETDKSAAVAKALEEAEAEKADALAKAREEAEDAKEEALALARADADAEKLKAVEAARVDANRDVDDRIEAAVTNAKGETADLFARSGATLKGDLKHYVLIGVSFIGGSLLAPGSRVTSADLGTYRDPVDGREKPVKPGETLVEINEDGSPIDEDGAWKLATVAGDMAGVPIAAVAPFSPNPTRPQGAPTQAPGGVSLVEGALRTMPPQGVESDAAAAARADQSDAAAASVAAMTAGDRPRRRGAQTGGAAPGAST